MLEEVGEDVAQTEPGREDHDEAFDGEENHSFVFGEWLIPGYRGLQRLLRSKPGWRGPTEN